MRVQKAEAESIKGWSRIALAAIVQSTRYSKRTDDIFVPFSFFARALPEFSIHNSSRAA